MNIEILNDSDLKDYVYSLISKPNIRVVGMFISNISDKGGIVRYNYRDGDGILLSGYLTIVYKEYIKYLRIKKLNKIIS